ncbi:uncharacterized protein LOC127721312 isoform X1 [Mytilus californianus]|uniref:uncharacterized protein LOC127721312 isoform X1 n=1 Tax=Mytilus californianus TaxID=6549 RepID=UPI002245C4E7|nr:uncharacterized protein LOC127721312 isoform X1 [Mytilus californianus]
MEMKEVEETEELVAIATKAVQSHEKLHLHLKRKRLRNGPKDVLMKSIQTLDNLREIKATADGSIAGFETPQIQDGCLVELKQLTLMNIPSTVTEDTKSKFQKLIFETFKGSCKKILCAVLVTCPWYEMTQKERGEQARHNTVYVIYMSDDEQSMAPVNQHVLDEAFVSDQGYLYSEELYHFVYFLAKGKTKCLEVLYCPESAVLYEDEAWIKLKNNLQHSMAMGVRGFIEACKGQSVAGIGKKGKDGKFKVKDTTTCQQFCDSFRLMQHLQNLLDKLPPFTSSLSVDLIPEKGKKGLELLKLLYQNTDVSKKDIFEVLTSWRDDVMKQINEIKFTNGQEFETIVGKWQLETRLYGRKITPLKNGLSDDHSKLCSLMAEIGGPVNKMEPEQIILIARAGSHMYGLSTPESDVDYVVIYAEKTETVLCACKPFKDNYESRGPTKPFEYGAYEARLFCEMLLKGSVVIVELVFTEDHDYCSKYWKNLCKEKEKFLTERTIQQYLGLIRNNFSMLDSEKHKGCPKDRKLFYQIFHKINCVEQIMKGKLPPVRCEGETREFIMKIRKDPLEGPLSRENLYKIAKDKFDKLLDDLVSREKRLKENMDYTYVTNWLLSVRGICD